MSAPPNPTTRHPHVVATHKAGDFVQLAAAVLFAATLVVGVVVWLQGNLGVGALVAGGGVFVALLTWLLGAWAMGWAEVHQDC